MGMYLNPGNGGFARIANSGYVDKTGMIALLNKTINTTKNLTCISRPRRFGKSLAAQMLCAYYDRSCDSHSLFDGYEIAKDSSYETYINKYDVLYLDMTGIIGETSIRDIVSFTKRSIIDDIRSEYPEFRIEEGFAATLVRLTEFTQRKIVMIIDEWDAPIREAKDDAQVQREYLEFLRSLFKNSGMTSRIFAAAYMTGILPIKKDGSESAISDCEEFTVIKPRQFGKYVGFTEDEVRALCEKYHVSFEMMKQWYDGYCFPDIGSVYNPNSVMKALSYNDFDSYWTETSAAEGLIEYISKPYHGLTGTIARLIGGVDVKIDTNGFANDLTTFKGKDDVLTLLIHLGYLAYDSETKTVHIPNEEIRREFQRSIRYVRSVKEQPLILITKDRQPRRERTELKTEVLSILREKGERSMNELATELNYARLTNTLRDVIHSMLKDGDIRYLYPDKPQSRNQKLRLTHKQG